MPYQASWRLEELSKINDLKNLKIFEFERFDLAFKYLLELKEWPKCNPVITGSIFLVAEFIKFANKQNI